MCPTFVRKRAYFFIGNSIHYSGQTLQYTGFVVSGVTAAAEIAVTVPRALAVHKLGSKKPILVFPC